MKTLLGVNNVRNFLKLMKESDTSLKIIDNWIIIKLKIIGKKLNHVKLGFFIIKLSGNGLVKTYFFSFFNRFLTNCC